MKFLLLASLLLAVVLCSCATDITRNPARMTDFIVGQVYSTKKPTFLLRGSLMTLREKEPAGSEGLVNLGARLVVLKVVVFRSPEVGTTTEVYAEVLTGEHKGITVSLTGVSESLKTGYTRRMPEVLELVEGEMR
jgi:hypothetical protein